MKIPRCKGARDLMPEEMQRFSRLKQVFRSTCRGWGYEEIRTPTIEYLHLFTSAGTLTPEMLSRVYSFLDWDGWSGERVVLRPDGTIPTARLYVESFADRPVARLFYIENMFSFEGTGEHSRERWQCGAELIGGRAPQGDAELIMLALEVLNALFISPVTVKISHIGLFNTLLNELGVADDQRDDRLRAILSGDASVLSEIGGTSEEVQRFLKLLGGLQGKSLGFLANLRAVLPAGLSALAPAIDGLAQVAELLDRAGQDYRIDLTSGEGFEYYTGIVFQFYCGETLIGNGGRYDELIGLVGGGDVPASGFALFLDPMLCLIPEDDSEGPEQILLAKRDPESGGMRGLFEAASRLREQGYVVQLDVGSGDPGDCRWVMNIAGDGESLRVDLQDTRTEDQRTGTLEEIIGVMGARG